jgi:hypothetical protein
MFGGSNQILATIMQEFAVLKTAQDAKYLWNGIIDDE